MMEVLCANVDCPIYYRRIKIKKEQEEKEKQMERFDSYMLNQKNSWSLIDSDIDPWMK